MRKRLPLLVSLLALILVACSAAPVLAENASVQCTAETETSIPSNICESFPNCDWNSSKNVCECSFTAPCNKPANICCTPDRLAAGQCSTLWDYAHDPYCVNAHYDPRSGAGTWECQWNYTHCGAGDRCPPCSGSGGSEAICAGQCLDTGCATGGWYKTCCQVAGAITGGARLSGALGTCSGSGGCSGTNVTTVRWGGFDSPGPSCSTTLCLRSGSWDGYSWIVDSCGTTPAATLPPGVTPTNPPPPPPPPGTFCGGCDSYWSCTWGDAYSGGCSVGPCERLYYGYGPDPCPVSGAHSGEGDCCSWCFSKGWGDDCGSAVPATPSLHSPDNNGTISSVNVQFRWYKYQTGESGKCGGCSASNSQKFCWGFRCATGGYGIPISQRKFELFVSRRPLSQGQAQSKNPADWGAARATIDTSTIPNNPELRVKGEAGYVAPDLISRTIDLGVSTPGTYWWFVRAKNPDGVKDSGLRSFNYCGVVPPTAANCTSPNGGLVNDTSTPFVWDAPGSWGNGCPTTKSYQVLLDEEGADYPPTSLACSSNTPASEPNTTCNYSGLEFGKNYYWRVKSINNPTNQTGYSFSNTCYFMVGEPGPWWQTTDGDVHAQGKLTSLIPSCTTTSEYLSNNGDGGTPGVVTWGGGSPLTLEEGTVSSLNWQANDLNRRPQVGFEYLTNRLNVDKSQEFNGSDLPSDSGTYYTQRSSFELQGGSVGTKKIVIFAEGEVRVMSDITVAKGGFFALIAKGRIIFDSTVTQAEGFFLTDSVIDTSIADAAFKGYGSFVAWGNFNLQRDLSNGTTGGCTPSEIFFARPDLYINAPKEFSITPSFFQEMAP